MTEPELEISKKRSHKIVKPNDIIQKARYGLSIRELKVMAYIFSMVKPTDKSNQEYIFSIIDYCKVCGIDWDNGKNYQEVKRTLKGIRDKSFWLTLPDGSETTVSWLEKPTVSPKRGLIKVKLDKDLQKYVIGTFDSYTQYELLSTLPMQSQYSFRIYELLKSYAYQKKHRFDVEDLKKQLSNKRQDEELQEEKPKKNLSAEQYTNFKDFRRRVLDIATNEINLYTDLEVSWEPEIKGRKVVAVTFTIKQRDSWGRLESSLRAEAALDKNLDEK